MGNGLLGALGRVDGGTASAIGEAIGPECDSAGVALLGCCGGVNCRGGIPGIGFEGGWGDVDPFLAGVGGGISSLRGIAGGTGDRDSEGGTDDRESDGGRAGTVRAGVGGGPGTARAGGPFELVLDGGRGMARAGVAGPDPLTDGGAGTDRAGGADELGEGITGFVRPGQVLLIERIAGGEGVNGICRPSGGGVAGVCRVGGGGVTGVCLTGGGCLPGKLGGVTGGVAILDGLSNDGGLGRLLSGVPLVPCDGAGECEGV